MPPQSVPPVPVSASTSTVPSPKKIGQFKVSWMLVRASFSILREDPSVLFFPILEAFFVTLFCTIFIGTTITVFWGSYSEVQSMPTYLKYALLFLFYLGTYFIAVFFKAGIMSIVHNQLNGGGTKFRHGLKGAWDRCGKLFLWSILAATIGTVLDLFQNRRERGLATIFNIAWGIGSYFAVPAIMIHNDYPFSALKDSIQTLKRTWGESIILYATIGTAFFWFYILLGFLGLFSLLTLIDHPIGLLCAISILTLALLVLLTLSSAASSVMRIVIYEYAATGKVAKGFSPDLLMLVIRQKGGAQATMPTVAQTIPAQNENTVSVPASSSAVGQ